MALAAESSTDLLLTGSDVGATRLMAARAGPKESRLTTSRAVGRGDSGFTCASSITRAQATSTLLFVARLVNVDNAIYLSSLAFQRWGCTSSELSPVVKIIPMGRGLFPGGRSADTLLCIKYSRRSGEVCMDAVPKDERVSECELCSANNRSRAMKWLFAVDLPGHLNRAGRGLAKGPALCRSEAEAQLPVVVPAVDAKRREARIDDHRRVVEVRTVVRQ